MDLLEGYFKFLKTQPLNLDGGSPTLLAVSGGLDSVVMAHLFKKAGYPFAIAHCNFQLRGTESDEDELFVQQVALDYEAPFFVKCFETRTYAEKHGLSTQMAARDLRYEWFAELATENGFSYVATAHHLNDSVETALLNFVRGTGLAGLSGISVKKDIQIQGPDHDPNTSGLVVSIIRPMLFATRDEILEYARAENLIWREDSSNALDDYARNQVRHHIIPRMEQLNPNFLLTAARNMEKIREAHDNLDFLLCGLPTLNGSEISLDKHTIARLPSAKQALRQLLQPYGFDAEQARQVAENLDHVGLELHSVTGYLLLIDRTKILLNPSTKRPNSEEPTSSPAITVQEDDLMIRLPDGSRVFLMPTSHPQIPVVPETNHPAALEESALVDAEKLQFPLHLRHWLPGDTFQPIGMGGKSQKLQDFFTNQKLTRFEKEEVWLLLNGDGALIWLVGRRLDERFKIHSETKKALKINWIK